MRRKNEKCEKQIIEEDKPAGGTVEDVNVAGVRVKEMGSNEMFVLTNDSSSVQQKPDRDIV